jgi:MYXO-CTERM domain-containing protein
MLPVMARRIDGLRLGLSLLVATLPLTAEAANALRPRTPATFPTDVPCVQTVQKGDVLHIDYAVPLDDTELTDDELPDSRRHQFFAFAQQRFDFRLPLWINQSDYDRAEANGDVAQYADAPILESDASWPAGTWVPITPDDPRLPITMAQAAMGVDWDTTDAPPGTWLVAAYTWEPEQNLWSHRFGAVRIVDAADPDATGPTVMLQLESSPIVNVGDAYAPTGCVEAPAGSTLTASWGLVDGALEPQWVPFVEDVPVETGPLDLELVPPAEAVGSVKLRVEITDPEGRSYVAYSPAVIGVLGSAGDDGAEDEGGDDEGDGGGGGCRLGASPGSPAWLALVVLGLVGLKRRKTR